MTKRFCRAQRAFLGLAFASLALSSFAQTQTTPTKPFEPTVGQSGKDVVWVPSPQELVDKIMELAKVTPSDYLIDLGAGDGRTVITAAKRGARALGIEYNPDMVELCKYNAAQAGVGDKVKFIKADIFESDFSEATVITMFLLPELNLRLRPKLLDLKPGTRIVSNTFTMGDWSSDETASADDKSPSDEYSFGSYRTALLWIVPAKVAGTWQSGKDDLVFTQNFQMIEGTVKNGSQSSAISNGRLRGDQIHFNAGDSEYSGTVNGNKMQGTVKSGGHSTAWTAILRAAQ